VKNVTVLQGFLRDNRGPVQIEYLAVGALVVLFLAAIFNTIFMNSQSRATATNTEYMSKVPSTPQ
jgi:Flp pilus assembly pilin Flp